MTLIGALHHFKTHLTNGLQCCVSSEPGCFMWGGMSDLPAQNLFGSHSWWKSGTLRCCNLSGGPYEQTAVLLCPGRNEADVRVRKGWKYTHQLCVAYFVAVAMHIALASPISGHLVAASNQFPNCLIGSKKASWLSSKHWEQNPQ